MAMHDAAIYHAETGTFISSKMQRLAEIIKDYDPYLELRWIPSDKRTNSDTLPYVVVDTRPGNPNYPVFYFSETTPPEEVLEKIFLGDNARQDVLAKVDARNAAIEAFRLKEQLDAMEEAHDQFHFLATSRSNNYVNWGRDPKTGKKIKLDVNRRRM